MTAKNKYCLNEFTSFLRRFFINFNIKVYRNIKTHLKSLSKIPLKRTEKLYTTLFLIFSSVTAEKLFKRLKTAISWRKIMKMSIEWHEKNLVNNKKHFERELESLKRKAQQVGRIRKEIKFKELQIETAKKKKKTGFDNELFLKKERKKFFDKK